MSKQSAIIEILKRYCDLLVSTGTEAVPHTGEVLWTGIGKQMEYVRVCEQIQRLRDEAAIPAGWRLVPVEPTAEMLIRGGEEFFDSARNREIGSKLNDQDHAAMIYEGMLSAALDASYRRAAYHRPGLQDMKSAIIEAADVLEALAAPAPPAVNQSLTTEVKR